MVDYPYLRVWVKEHVRVMIGNSGSVIWDGIAEDNSQLNTGMYIIWVEVFSENGNVERFKEVVVLSR